MTKTIVVQTKAIQLQTEQVTGSIVTSPTSLKGDTTLNPARPSKTGVNSTSLRD